MKEGTILGHEGVGVVEQLGDDPEAGTSFFGGPEMTGPVDGLQVEPAPARLST